MAMIDAIRDEFENEAANTRRMLERVPGEHLAWRPHEKSMTLGMLGSHLVEIPTWAKTTMEVDEFVMDMTTYRPVAVENVNDMVRAFDQNVADAKAAMTGVSDDVMMAPWRMLMNGSVVIDMPRVAVMRGMVLNHAIHHRGQLSVYLRLKDVPVPSTYGPTADEGNMMG